MTDPEGRGSIKHFDRMGFAAALVLTNKLDYSYVCGRVHVIIFFITCLVYIRDVIRAK